MMQPQPNGQQLPAEQIEWLIVIADIVNLLRWGFRLWPAEQIEWLIVIAEALQAGLDTEHLCALPIDEWPAAIERLRNTLSDL